MTENRYFDCDDISFSDDAVPHPASIGEAMSDRPNQVMAPEDAVASSNDANSINKETRKSNRRKAQRPRRIKNSVKSPEFSYLPNGKVDGCGEYGEETTDMFNASDTSTQVNHEDCDAVSRYHSETMKKKTHGSKRVPCVVCNRLFAKRSMEAHLQTHGLKSPGATDEQPKAGSRRSTRAASIGFKDYKEDSGESEDEAGGRGVYEFDDSELASLTSTAARDEVPSSKRKPVVKRGDTKTSCSVCDRSFTKREMAAHMRTHKEAASAKKYLCYVCDRPFTKLDMAKHLLTHDKVASASAPAPPLPPRRKRSRAEDVSSDADEGAADKGSAEEEEEDSAEGDDVGKAVAAAKSKRKKKKKLAENSKRQRLPCSVCGGLYNKSYLAEHKRSHTGEKPFTCGMCDRQFTSANSLKVHKKNVHSDEHGKIECNVCGRLMSSKTSLEQHLLTHSSEKPFQCEICGKAFKQPSVLSNHMKTHNDGMPYQCEACGRRYKSVQGLVLHRKFHHEGLKLSFQCDICGKVFTRRMKLKDHIMWHKGVSPYKCQYCDKRLLSRKTLRTHLLIHEDKKPYECTVCGKAFRQNCVLKRHMSVHTGVKPFSCELCGKQFIHRVYLVKHTCEVQDGNRVFLSL